MTSGSYDQGYRRERMAAHIGVGKEYQPEGKSYSDGTARDAKDFIRDGRSSRRVPVLARMAWSLPIPIARECSARCRGLYG